MDPNTIMTFAGKSMQVDSWVVTGFLKKTTCYLIGQQSDGKFVFVFQNPVTRTPTVLSINARDVSNLTLASPPSFSYDDALYEHEPAVLETFDEYLEYLALGIEDIILVQDPHYVILGGILTPFAEVVLPPLQEKIFRENNFYDGTDRKVMCSTLHGNSVILGAALLPCQGVLC